MKAPTNKDQTNAGPDTSSLPRVAFVSMGQTPRPDLTDEIIELSGCSFDHDEYGALDGLDEFELEMLGPVADDERVHTRLADGSSIVLAAAPVETRIANICSKLDGEEYDLIVVLSTLMYCNFRTFTPVLHAQGVIDTWFASLSMTECDLGVVNLLQKQGEITRRRLGSMIKVQTSCALDDRNDYVEETARKLKNCDIILLSSVSYSEATAKKIEALAGRPVVTARRVVANALRLQLGYIAGKQLSNLTNLTDRLLGAAPSLTDRELEIAELAIIGLSNKEVGLKLGISHRTVEKHRANAMHKLGVTTISGLMRFALMP